MAAEHHQVCWLVLVYQGDFVSLLANMVLRQPKLQLPGLELTTIGRQDAGGQPAL